MLFNLGGRCAGALDLLLLLYSFSVCCMKFQCLMCLFASFYFSTIERQWKVHITLRAFLPFCWSLLELALSLSLPSFYSIFKDAIEQTLLFCHSLFTFLSFSLHICCLGCFSWSAQIYRLWPKASQALYDGCCTALYSSATTTRIAYHHYYYYYHHHPG